jgi:DNA-binding response OmpR family regulator
MNSKLRILLVDDNPDDRALVRREAEALFPGAEIQEAGSREQCDHALASGNFDLVVTDLHLRWGSGAEILGAVRETSPGTAVVMFTGTGDEITAVELMKAGLDDYVVKHARQLPRLRASMKLALDNRRQRPQLSERERQLTAALAQKDLVVRELHHRVKNNLQTVINLLSLRGVRKEEISPANWRNWQAGCARWPQFRPASITLLHWTGWISPPLYPRSQESL